MNVSNKKKQKKIIAVMPAFNAESTLEKTFQDIPKGSVDDVILIDDMIDTAGTMVKAAEALKKLGATSVMACCTHPVLSGPAYERIEEGELDELVVANTIPMTKRSPKIKMLSTASMLGEVIRRVHNNESVNSLFETNT